MSRYLLDTQIWLWLEGEPSRVPSPVRDLLASADVLMLSTASAWEIAIKVSIGKLDLGEAPGVFVPRQVAANGLWLLPVTLEHALGVATLPRHHGDPFDRLLVSQARLEELTVVSADRAMEKYDVDLLPV